MTFFSGGAHAENGGHYLNGGADDSQDNGRFFHGRYTFGGTYAQRLDTVYHGDCTAGDITCRLKGFLRAVVQEVHTVNHAVNFGLTAFYGGRILFPLLSVVRRLRFVFGLYVLDFILQGGHFGTGDGCFFGVLTACFLAFGKRLFRLIQRVV